MTPTFRQLTRTELDTVLTWATTEGWNPGRHDADAFWAADPEGFYGLELQGELIGSGSIVSYAGKLGFVGLFIMRPEWRGKGLGTQLWNSLIARLRARLDAGAPAALDGVFAMQDYYAKSGFVYTHRNLRMEGVGTPAPRAAELVALHTLPFGQVLDFDRAHFGAPREEFLRHWIHPKDGLALGWLHDDRLAGCGVARPCARGYKLGPLFAETPEIAGALFRTLSDFAAGHPIFLDTPEINPAALALAERHGLKECFGCARMVMGPAPKIPWQRIFGVTTFELG
jgi:GNAT superfamily N-acetyltransferase